MEYVLKAIEMDNSENGDQSETLSFTSPDTDPNKVYRPGKFLLPDYIPSCIINLRLEEAKLTTGTVQSFVSWMHSKPLLRSLCLIKIKFEERKDFRDLCLGIQVAANLEKLMIS